MLENIQLALDGLDPGQPPRALLRAAVETNVRHTMRVLAESLEGRERLARGGVILAGAVYELETGRVRFLD